VTACLCLIQVNTNRLKLVGSVCIPRRVHVGFVVGRSGTVDCVFSSNSVLHLNISPTERSINLNKYSYFLSSNVTVSLLCM
jgi:hypothetical protein